VNIGKKDYSIHRFKKALEIACSTLGVTMEQKRNRHRNNTREIRVPITENAEVENNEENKEYAF